jgi:hypothetical protein
VSFYSESEWTKTTLTPETMAPEWMPLPLVFGRLVRLVGAPDLAAIDLRRALNTGLVGALALRNAGNEEEGANWQQRELSHEFWRRVMLKPTKDEKGADTLRFPSPAGTGAERPESYFPWYFYLLRADVDNLWPDHDVGPAATKKSRSSPESGRAQRAIAALYPDGVPDQAELPNKLLQDKVNGWLTDQRLDEVKPDSILRAAGRRR